MMLSDTHTSQKYVIDWYWMIIIKIYIHLFFRLGTQAKNFYSILSVQIIPRFHKIRLVSLGLLAFDCNLGRCLGKNSKGLYFYHLLSANSQNYFTTVQFIFHTVFISFCFYENSAPLLQDKIYFLHCALKNFDSLFLQLKGVFCI